MPYILGKLWHLAIIWAIRKAFQCILQGVRFLLAKYTRISPTSENESYITLLVCIRLCVYIRLPQVGICAPNIQQLLPTGQMVRQNLYVYFPPYLAYIFTHTHTYITQLLRKTHIVTQKHAKKKQIPPLGKIGRQNMFTIFAQKI